MNLNAGSAMMTVVSAAAVGAVTWQLSEFKQPVEEPTPVIAAPVADLDDTQLETTQDHIRVTELSLDLAWAGRSTLEIRPEEFPDDCSRFVAQAVRRAGIPMRGRVSMLWKRALEYEATHYNPHPYIGDLVFFDNTYDSNTNGRWDDQTTHIALVTDVDPDGTITMAHWGGRRHVVYMNLFEPHTHQNDDGKVLNSYLRAPKKAYPHTAMYLSGQLWSGFATISFGQNWVSLAAWEKG
jgi:hypothetical protein